ncbi:MAG: SMI1/KNR4 family protein [Bacteroidota bacterium]
MTKDQVNYFVPILERQGVIFEEGLAKEEIIEIESLFGIQFPSDLGTFLGTRLPVSQGFIDWREAIQNEEVQSSIENRLAWPMDGLLFDIEHNDFWFSSWGSKPPELQKRLRVASQNIKNQPKLIPIYSHRYISSLPNESGNPVFSVYQTDIIYYGLNLADYFSNEFEIILPESFQVKKEPKEIPFWAELVS